MADTGAQLSTKIVKVFDTDNSFAEKIKHELIPKLEYSFIPDTDQDNVPQFDTLDKIYKQNLLTWSMTNYLISRKSGKSSKEQEAYTYNDFSYVKLYQSFDINKRKNENSEPFSDLFFTGRFYPNNKFSINTDFAYSPYDNQFSQYSIGGTIKDKRGDMLISEYRYNRGNFESLFSEISTVLKEGSGGYNNRPKQSLSSESSLYNPHEISPELTMTYSIETNLKDNNTLETKAGLRWEKECWNLELARSESKGDVSVGFMINFHNLGSL
jgi:LPS-assembly protein